MGGKRAEITGARKVFFIDNGVRNQLFGGFGPLAERGDRGALLENFVFSELAKTLDPLLDGLSSWRSKSGAEMDFVVEHQGRLLAVEVTAGDSRGNLSRSARSFVEAYQPEQLLVVHSGAMLATELEQTAVCFLAVEQLASVVESFLATTPPAPP